MRAPAALFLAVTLAGCATPLTSANTTSLPPGVYGVYLDNDVGAINFASWAFASPANTRGNPVEAIRAIVALEYLSIELVENPRWVRVDSLVKNRVKLARDSLREVVAIRPDAPSQLVVNTLLALSDDLQAGDQDGTTKVLASPIFLRSPQDTLQTLTNLPYVQQANLATVRVAQQAFSNGGPAS